MAYKFQLGDAIMSGALAQEGTLEVIDDEGSLRFSVNRDSGLISGSGNLRVVGSAHLKSTLNVSGAVLAGAGITSTAAANTFGASSFSDANITNVGDIALDSISADGSSFSFGSDWTAAGRTCANLGSVTTADINGGNIDGTIIGANSAQAGTFTALVGTSLSVSDGNITNVGDIALDTISADGTTIEIDMTDNQAGAFSISEGANDYLKFDTTDASPLMTVGVGWTAASQTCANLGSVTTADLNGGSIDNMAIGAAVQSSVKATTLSASSTLDVVGVSRYHGLATFNAGVASTTLSASSNLDVVGNITSHGAVSFSGSSVRFYGLSDDTDFAEASDSLFYYDAGSKSMKRMLNSTYLGDIAGAGLSVSSGKLTTDAATGVIRWGNAAVTLQEGFNVATASFSQARTWTLPASPSVSDVVRVKKHKDAYPLTIAGAGSQTIDGLASIILESPSGSVSLVYVAANRWSVY